MKKTRPSIALAFIAKDKADILERMLNSTKGAFDYYVMQDTGSSDDTVKVFKNWCKKNNYKFKVNSKKVTDYDHVVVDGVKTLGDFATARNDSFDLAKTFDPDYIFWMDTDDVLVGAENMHKIAEVMQKENYDGAIMDYDYATAKDGLKAVVQKRERLIDANTGGEWKYNVHENYIFDNAKKVKAAIFNEAKIVHKRTVNEVVKTNRRNQLILQKVIKQKGVENVDFKVLNDIAYDHWEHKEFEEAIKYYEIGLSREEKVSDDMLKVIYHKLAVAYMGLGKQSKAISYLYKLQKVEPKDPFAYLNLAEIALNDNRLEDAVHYAKQVKKIGKPNSIHPYSEVDIIVKPNLILIEALTNLGQLEQAKEVINDVSRRVANENIKHYEKVVNNQIAVSETVESVIKLYKFLQRSNNIEDADRLLLSIPTEVKDHNAIRQLIAEIKIDYNIKTKKYPLNERKNIVIYAGPHYEPWDGESDIKKGIGGSEGMTIQISRELAKLNNDVTIYGEPGDSDGKVFKGVKYLKHDKFDFNADNTDIDIFIGLRNPNLFTRIVETKRKYLWLHDTGYGDVPAEVFNTVNKVIALSEAHIDVLQKNHTILDEQFWLTRNGYNQYAYKKALEANIKRDKNRLIYASSYDRGLINALEMWPKIKEEVPEAQLDVYYGWNTFDAMMEARQNTPAGEQMKTLKDKILKLLDQDGIKEHGRVSQVELYKAFAKSAVWFYPTEFYEISCINAMTAQALGAFPVVTNYAALNETVGDYGHKTELNEIQEVLIYQLKNQDEKERKEMMSWASKKYSMESLAKSWNKYFNEN